MNIVSRDVLIHTLSRISSYITAYGDSRSLSEREVILNVIDVALADVRKDLDMERTLTDNAKARGEQ